MNFCLSRVLWSCCQCWSSGGLKPGHFVNIWTEQVFTDGYVVENTPPDYPGIKTVLLHSLFCEYFTEGASLLHLLGFSPVSAFHRQERGNWMCRLLEEIFGAECFRRSTTSASLTEDKTRVCILLVSLLLWADNYTRQLCLVSTVTLKYK